MDAESLWPTFAEHLHWLYPRGAAPDERIGPGWCAVATGEQHPDLNLGVLTAAADPSDAAAVVSYFGERGVPAAVSVASALAGDVTGVLAESGYERAPQPEALMWSSTAPATGVSPFRVEPVGSASDVAAAIAVASEGHGIEGLDQVIEQAPFSGRNVNAWLAWEGDQPLSVVWLTVARQIGVWAMMTPPQHRRRGAGRAVLSAALARTWSDDIDGSFLWSSPMGRPLYESLGYMVLDECWIWVLGGTEEMLAILGNT
jgi:GNAT superfamily N-acetyltransferase